jgi:disulfide oxidoreductase YuzD
MKKKLKKKISKERQKLLDEKLFYGRLIIQGNITDEERKRLDEINKILNQEK